MAFGPKFGNLGDVKIRFLLAYHVSIIFFVHNGVKVENDSLAPFELAVWWVQERTTCWVGARALGCVSAVVVGVGDAP